MGAQEHGNEAEGLAGADPQGLGRSCEPGANAGGDPGEDYRDALEAGDERAAARLKHREPGVHIGPHNVARAERGVVLERPATARAVEDRNQEFKTVSAEVREMEGALERVRASIVRVSQKLAAYVRERLERSRGRSGPDRGGPDHGWSR